MLYTGGPSSSAGSEHFQAHLENASGHTQRAYCPPPMDSIIHRFHYPQGVQ